MDERRNRPVMPVLMRLRGLESQGCRSREADLWSYAAGKVGEQERMHLEAHLLACPACRRSLAAVRLVTDGLKAEGARPLPVSRTGWEELRKRMETEAGGTVAAPAIRGSALARWRYVPGFAVATIVIACIVLLRTAHIGKQFILPNDSQGVARTVARQFDSQGATRSPVRMQLASIEAHRLRAHVPEAGIASFLAMTAHLVRPGNGPMGHDGLSVRRGSDRDRRVSSVHSKKRPGHQTRDIAYGARGETHELHRPEFVLTSVVDGEAGTRRFVMDSLSSEESQNQISNGRRLARENQSLNNKTNDINDINEGEVRELQGW